MPGSAGRPLASARLEAALPEAHRCSAGVTRRGGEIADPIPVSGSKAGAGGTEPECARKGGTSPKGASTRAERPCQTGDGSASLKETADPNGHSETDMTLATESQHDHPPAGRARRTRRFVGGFYLTMAGINAGIVFADPHSYQHFADGAYLDFVTDQWNDIVMANPSFWGLLLAAGEILLGVLLLSDGPGARIGWVGVIAFHGLLMLFGPGTWLWCIPALAVLVPTARADWPQIPVGRPAKAHHVQPAR